MKTTDTKTSATQVQAKKGSQSPFFDTEGADNVLASEKSFFSPPGTETGGFFNPPVQAKLTIGAPDDAYEKEADATAEKVVQRLAETPSESAVQDPVLQRSVEPVPIVQRAPAPVQRACATCGKEESKEVEEEAPDVQEKLQRKPIFDSSPPGAEDEGGPPGIQRQCAECAEREQVQRSEASAATPAPGADFSARLSSSKGGGAALPAEVGAEMGQAMDADFSGVRVHTGSEAANMSQSIQAQAFTHGSDIYFNEGKYDTGSTDGKQLLAHELTHTVQQGGAGVKRDCLTAELCLTNIETIRPQLTEAIFQSLATNILDDEWDFQREMLSGVESVLPSEYLAQYNEKILIFKNDISTSYRDSEIGFETALIYLRRVFEVASDENFHDIVVNVPIDHILRVLSGKFAVSLMSTLPGASPELTISGNTAEGELYELLFNIGEVISNPTRVLEFDLEATMGRLLGLRIRMAVERNRENKIRMGAEIGELARRALLLNLAIHTATPSVVQGQATPLDNIIQATSGEILRIRNLENSERETLQGLGNDPSLLTNHSVNMDNPVTTTSSATQSISLLEAFPVTSDEMSNRFMEELEGDIQSQMREVQRTHDAVVPANPTYELEEFASVFSRWYAFFSLEQERQDPTVEMISELMGQPYQMMGSGALSGVGAISGATGRAYLMNLYVDLLQDALQGPETQFIRQLPRSTRVQSVQGPATSPVYSTAEIYNSRASGRSSGEAQTRESRAQEREFQTAVAFNAVQQLPPALQPAAAVQAGIADSPAPIIGLRTVESAQGFSYLMDVYANDDYDRENPIAREHKVMPPEVTRYLMANAQHNRTIQQAHFPRSGGTVIGEPQMASRGVESAEASARSIYLEGNEAPEISRQATSLRETRSQALHGARGRQDQSQGANQLINEFYRYFDAYYENRLEPAYRIATIFHIANVQFGIGRDISNLITIENISKIVAQSLQIALTQSALQMFGKVGDLLSHAYRGYLSAQGVSELAAAVSLAEFLRSASQVNSFREARAWSYMMPALVGDMSELFESLISMPVTNGFDHLTRRQPRTPIELADAVRNSPLMENETSRVRLLEAINSQVATLESQGAGVHHSSPEYDALIHFRDGLLQRSSQHQGQLSSDGNMELPGRQTRSDDFDTFAAGRIRTQVERAALHAALGQHSDVPLIENPALMGTSVRVHYDNGRLRMEVGPLADASHVRAHLDTVRHLKRYQGIVGTIRRLMERLTSHLTGMPGYGTQGFEARAEVIKLNAILSDLRAQQSQIDQRANHLSDDSTRALDGAETRAIDLEIDSIRAQIDMHTRSFNSFEQGRGFIAADDWTRQQARGRALEMQIEDTRGFIEAEMENARVLPGIIEKLRRSRQTGDQFIRTDNLTEHELEILGQVFHESDIDTLTLQEVQQGRDNPGRLIEQYRAEEQRAISQLRDSMRPLYDRVRAASPSTRVRDQVMRSARGMDQVSGAPPISGNLAVDHIVSLREIVDMPGFRELSWENQSAIANYRDNLMAIDRVVNSSKQDSSWSDPFSARSNYSADQIRQAIQIETRMRQVLQAEITRRLPVGRAVLIQ